MLTFSLEAWICDCQKLKNERSMNEYLLPMKTFWLNFQDNFLLRTSCKRFTIDWQYIKLSGRTLEDKYLYSQLETCTSTTGVPLFYQWPRWVMSRWRQRARIKTSANIWVRAKTRIRVEFRAKIKVIKLKLGFRVLLNSFSRLGVRSWHAIPLSQE